MPTFPVIAFVPDGRSRFVFGGFLLLMMVALLIPPGAKYDLIKTGTADSYSPSGLALDLDQNLYVADTPKARILKFNPRGHLLQQFPHSDTFGSSISIDSSGNLYLCNETQVIQLGPNGTHIHSFETFLPLHGPVSCILDSGNNIYVTDAIRIVKFSPNGTPLQILTTVSPTLSHPRRMAVDSDQNLYVADSGNSRIVKFSPHGTPLQSVILQFEPHDVVVDASHSIYVAGPGSDAVIRFDPQGVEVQSLRASEPKLGFLSGLAMDAKNNLYVSDHDNGRIVKFVSWNLTRMAWIANSFWIKVTIFTAVAIMYIYTAWGPEPVEKCRQISIQIPGLISEIGIILNEIDALVEQIERNRRPAEFHSQGIGSRAESPISNDLDEIQTRQAQEEHESLMSTTIEYPKAQYCGGLQEGRYCGEIQAGRYCGEIQAGRYCGEIQAGRYCGEVQGGQPQGRGKGLFRSGNAYEGSWQSGQRQGQGKMVFANGVTYEGSWHSGKFHGQGRICYPSGTSYTTETYIGEFREGRPNGIGELLDIHGQVYKGQIRNGEPEGLGRMIYLYPTNFDYDMKGTYEGQWLQGQTYGLGRISYTVPGIDGDVYTYWGIYEGEWIENRCVRGRMSEPDGVVSEGQWLRCWGFTASHGYCKTTYPSGKVTYEYKVLGWPLYMLVLAVFIMLFAGMTGPEVRH